MKNLLVIGGATDLNLKKFYVGWFERVLESEFFEMEEMGLCLCYKKNVAAVNYRWKR